MSVEIGLFLNALFHPCPVDGRMRIEVRCLPPQTDATRSQSYAGITLKAHRDWFALTPFGITHAIQFCTKMAPSHEVYCGVNPRMGEAGSSESVPLCSWLYADIDGGEEGVPGARELAKKAVGDLVPCHMAVVSGGGLHVYWKLQPYATFGGHEERRFFSGYLKRLVLTIGGTSPSAHADDSCTDLARILRVPGTINHKRNRSVKLVHHKPDLGAYCLDAFDALLHPIPNPRPIIASTLSWTFNGTVPDSIKRWAEKPYPEGKRHKDLTSAAAWLVRDLHIPKQYVEELLLTKARVSYGNRAIEEDEVRSIVKWA